MSSSSPSKLRKDADAKIGGPHFHSSTMLERSSSMSRIAQQDKADVEKRRHSGPLSVEELILSGKLQRGSLSLQLDSQLTPSNELQKSRAVDGGNEGRSDALAVDIDGKVYFPACVDHQKLRDSRGVSKVGKHN